ncbi:MULTISPECIES: diaminobutyrate--2-oxoglutarate transaminase [unclassified Bradyrhizobium]|uniref:diaminobutyrate--2-oxoglutarate transaminase n=1 Tax=Bradyrhizobium TaxID=374 RepID=UPI002342A8A7|nr:MULTISPECIES: diaminobutyrate--2-oxoglutarate transaminase [unclassified Bradyrhizobium]GLH80068.1 diaminobutyrate--2-oxoglutarate transaminase [Bradyrhizobium sp. SSBR45G]GLH87623.1 diaminobutyrate--2-oxoglutarate transaminase [Bradyrhizobium sp. SSBR45R]
MNVQGIDVESEVRSYCRSYPATFSRATSAFMVSETGERYLDFLSGCGALNYGHNNVHLKSVLMDYLSADGIALGLDLKTGAKNAFVEAFSNLILGPRSLPYRIQFPGPTGANAVEAAIKLARKVTKRTNIVAFSNAFHGCSLGALALTANSYNRESSSPLLTHVDRALYDGYLGSDICTADILDRQLGDPSGGLDKPAAIIVEVVQGEGGLNVASRNWLQKIAAIAAKSGALFIVDEIQAGCGRTGSFFSFENYGVVPDIVTMAKSVSGFGLPMSLVLLRPQHDVWSPGEHNGTFRGNNHAFVTATAALRHYWADEKFELSVRHKSEVLSDLLGDYCESRPFRPKGLGLMQGIDVKDPRVASEVKAEAYRQKIVVELCGPLDEVVKLMPPLTISEEDLVEGAQRLLAIVDEVFARQTLVSVD